MKTVTLISKQDCHLCDLAKEVLLNVQRKVPFTLDEKKIAPGDADFETYHERVPVILIDGKFAFHYKVSEGQLEKRLRA